MSTQTHSTPAPQSPLEPRAELEDLPWTGVTVVVAVLGLLMFMAIPMGGSNPAARLEAQRERIAFLAQERFRNAIEDYRGDHGNWPGQVPALARTLSAPVYGLQPFEQQLMMHSDLDGATLPTREGEFTFGPYLPNGIPTNPQNGLNTVRLLQPGESFDRIYDGVYGWVYDPRTGEIQQHTLPFQRTQIGGKPSLHVGRSN